MGGEYPATFRSMQAAMRVLIVLVLPTLVLAWLPEPPEPCMPRYDVVSLLHVWTPYMPPCPPSPDFTFAYWLVPAIVLSVIALGVSSARHPDPRASS